jgi:uncharacterized Zn finger protein (UPF0148 family)
MRSTPDPLLPLGHDCDCGHPLVWRDGKPWCAVYGSHPLIVHVRNQAAPGAQLVRDLSVMPLPLECSRRRKYPQAVSAA